MNEQMHTNQLFTMGERYLSLYPRRALRERTASTLKQQFNQVCWGTAAGLLALALAALWPG